MAIQILGGGVQFSGGASFLSWTPPPNFGSLRTWGLNSYGQLGNATATNRSSPGTVAGGGTTWSQVAGGKYHSAAVKSDGTLWTWGYGTQGSLGYTVTSPPSPDYDDSPATVAGGGTTWGSVACGYAHTAAIKTDGTLWTWGRGSEGQLGNGSNAQTASPGTVAGGGTTWLQVSSGYNHLTAIKTDGTLWTWGRGNDGQLGNGSTANTSSPGTVAGGGTTWASVAAGSYYGSAAIKTDGTLWTWGQNFAGGLGNNSTAATSSPGTVAGGGTTWASVACGYQHTAAIKTDGTLWTWGYNSWNYPVVLSGQLGNGSTIVGTSSPNTVAGGGTTWASVACGTNYTAAIKTDGTLWTWGENSNGTLGNSTTTNRSSPGTVSGGGTTWLRIAIGNGHALAITY